MKRSAISKQTKRYLTVWVVINGALGVWCGSIPSLVLSSVLLFYRLVVVKSIDDLERLLASQYVLPLEFWKVHEGEVYGSIRKEPFRTGPIDLPKELKQGDRIQNHAGINFELGKPYKEFF